MGSAFANQAASIRCALGHRRLAMHLEGLVAHPRAAERDGSYVGPRKLEGGPQSRELSDGASQAVTDEHDAIWRAALGLFQYHLRRQNGCRPCLQRSFANRVESQTEGLTDCTASDACLGNVPDQGSFLGSCG